MLLEALPEKCRLHVPPFTPYESPPPPLTQILVSEPTSQVWDTDKLLVIIQQDLLLDLAAMKKRDRHNCWPGRGDSYVLLAIDLALLHH
jgi:hypothetical protein